jgi:uncharacterized membrane protein YkoI
MDDAALTKAAVDYAQQHGRNIQDYSPPSLRREDGTARVFFQGKVLRPGNHFTVLLNAETGQVIRLIPGR